MLVTKLVLCLNVMLLWFVCWWCLTYCCYLKRDNTLNNYFTLVIQWRD